jgi:hypothetical protein
MCKNAYRMAAFPGSLCTLAQELANDSLCMHGCGHRMLQPSPISNALIASSWLDCEHDVLPLIGPVRDVCQMSLSISVDNAVATKHMMQEAEVEQ